MHILILAGGGGTRLWPLSRQDFPKQFLRFGDQNSLLQKTVLRFLHSKLAKTISIATNSQYAPLVEEQLEAIGAAGKIEIIIEPAKKNTAPAIAFSVKILEEKGKICKSDTLLILPSDHLIEPQSVFVEYLEEVNPLVQKNHLLLFGICPTKPETGYGYIQIDKRFDHFTYQVKRFVEKPDLQTAKSYLFSGNYYWNSGIFACTVSHFWEILQEFAPQIANLSFSEMPDISFDYAVLEKCRDALVCPLPVTWSDVGCWDSVYDVMQKDENQNVKFGNVISLDTKNSLIISDKRLISTIGVEDLLIVETDDAIFIGRKGESQKVKDLVTSLRELLANKSPSGLIKDQKRDGKDG